ncbi:signal recognition particle-docking protein FtsY [Pasteurella sp. PK-2025]|uniref:signal recognition particle-docking protein FtsY n=1 Tax=Pasteurella sp. PK-2025 TaxID=3413133 RepID=UPI003C78676B
MASENKKGGFWSWLGLGKKKDTQDEAQTQSSSAPSSIESSPTSETDHTTDTKHTSVQSAVDFEKSLPETTEQAAKSPSDLAESTDQPTTPEAEKLEAVAVDVARENEEMASVSLVEPQTESDTQPESTAREAKEEQKEENEQKEESEQTDQTKATAEENAVNLVETAQPHPQEQEKPSEGGFFSRLVKGLLKTKQNIGAGFRSFFLGKKIDDELFEELEEQLLVADLGVPTTSKIIHNLTQHASRKQLQDAELLYQQLKVEMASILTPVAQPLVIDHCKKPYVILMVGVNGVGKTTTIGKLARKFQQEGKSVMLAAGDTFRAAAVEQLQVWGERNHIPVVAQATGADSASVIFDAMQSAAARGVDVLIADTAGRLQNKNHLMDELKKIVRVMKKYDETAPHEIMLTLDAGTGQNAISQAKLFHEAVGLTGISLTKLDGTAKGGVIFAIADQFNLPIRYIGVGEKIEDLREFKADEFIEALFTHEE